jgi:hypothetical protein
MFKYRVVHGDPGVGRVALQDGKGRYHTARALDRTPEPGAALDGTRPHLGFGVLQCRQSGHRFRVVFEKINSPHLDHGLLWF